MRGRGTEGPDRQEPNFRRGSQGADPRYPRVSRVSDPRVAGEAARFWPKVTKTDGCWLWTGAKVKGYGRFKVWRDGRWTHVRAHRWAYEALEGPIPPGIYPDHLCHTNDLACPGGPTCPHRACVRPDHLEPVTDEENRRRANARRGT